MMILMCPHCQELQGNPEPEIVDWADQESRMPVFRCNSCGGYFTPPVVLGSPLFKPQENKA